MIAHLRDAIPHVAIIGGGYSGMAAAVRTIELGGTVTVFEAATILGGRARRIEYAGRVMDNGQHILSGAYRELLRLMDVVGTSASDYERVPLTLNMPPAFMLRAPLLPTPLHMVAALLNARGLRWGDRFAAIKLMSVLKKTDFVVPRDMSVASFLKAHRQPTSLIKFLWQPLTISALNTPIENASAQVFANVLHDALAGAREASDLLLPKVDLSALFPDPAAAWVTKHGGKIVTGMRISAVEQVKNTVRIVAKDTATLFDAAIIAVGPHQRAALHIEGAYNDTHHTYEPIVTIYFGFHCADSLPTPMLGQAAGLVQWFFDRRAISTASTDTELVISAVISASGPHDRLSQDELATAALTELRTHMPSLPMPIWQKVISEKFATFACTPDATRPTPRTCFPQVWLAGDDVQNPLRQYPATLEGAARNGIQAAALALASCRGQ